jgi:DNA-binding XRE family transcriptional regulator
MKLGRLRNDRQWSYDTLAEKTGVSRRTLIAMETGTTNGRLDSWFRIAQAFGISIAELLEEI